MELESMRQRALDVAQDALNSRQVLFAWVVHVKTHLLNGVGDVRAREGEVLESPGDEGMTNGPPIFAYLVFGPGRDSLERLLGPIKAAV
jgi:hypothetical protein